MARNAKNCSPQVPITLELKISISLVFQKAHPGNPITIHVDSLVDKVCRWPAPYFLQLTTACENHSLELFYDSLVSKISSFKWMQHPRGIARIALGSPLSSSVPANLTVSEFSTSQPTLVIVGHSMVSGESHDESCKISLYTTITSGYFTAACLASF